MLLDMAGPHFSPDLKLRLIYGYAGVRADAEPSPNKVEGLEKPYSPRLTSWMRKRIERLVLAGGLTNFAIAKLLGVSRAQVNYTSRRLFLRNQGQKAL